MACLARRARVRRDPLIEAAPAFITWLGAALVVLSDGRRGLAAGVALLSAGFGILAWVTGDAGGGMAVVAGGAAATWSCWRWGPAGWGIMPAGSTPRLVLCVASGLLALWVAASVTSGGGESLRFCVLVVLGMMGARVLMSRQLSVALAATACFALALAMAPGLSSSSSETEPVPQIVGALIAAGVTLVRRAAPEARPEQRGA